MEMLYYPGFNITNVDWLKYALLYIENISPIIPENGLRYQSDVMKQVTEETNLITPYCPTSDIGVTATHDAMDKIDKILRYPERYVDVFYHANILTMWRRPENHNVELFCQKYSPVWFKYCIENGLGTKSENGILVNEQLSSIYMTILAECICEREGVPQITDNIHLDRYSVFSRRITPRNEDAITVRKSVYNQVLPTNISAIPIEKIIELRNSEDYLVKLKAFNFLVDKYLSEDTDELFRQYLYKANMELFGALFGLFTKLAHVVASRKAIANNAT